MGDELMFLIELNGSCIQTRKRSILGQVQISGAVWFIWDVITRPCHNFNGGLPNPSLSLGMDEYVFWDLIYWIIPQNSVFDIGIRQ